VDWPCTVHKDYSDKNLGCKMRVVSGLNWVFEQAEEAIIIEDDCVPDQSFFPFCQELLEKYRNEPRVTQIAGLNTQHKNKKFSTGGASYYFSQFGEIWGWATWRRAWALYDVTLEQWPEAKVQHLLDRRIKDPAVVDYWEHLFDTVYGAGENSRKFDAWAAQWVFALLLHGGLSAVPTTNLMRNLGDDKENATRFRENSSEEDYALRPVLPLTFPLIHPKQIEVNEQADNYTLHSGFRIKRRVGEKVLFFLKRRAPAVHSALKRLRQSS
jgi:hypothetical protein